jgi:beta-lactamase regulating signal transducer with metallopeptidase domain
MSQMWSHPWIAAILAAAVRGAPLLLIAAVAALGWRRSSAAARHLVWLVAIAAMLALPLLSASLPAWRVALLPPPEVEAAAVEQPIVSLPEAISPSMVDVVSKEASTATMPAALSFDAPPAQGAPARDWGRVAFFIWCIGAALVALPMLLGHARVWRISKTARPAIGGPWGALASVLPDSLGLTGRVRVMVSERATMPMAFGIMNPAVLLPADAEQWPFARRRDVMLHELEHVARRDCLTQLVSQAACALYWFDPLVWLAARALRAERERACDDAVVRAGARPSEYATHLLQVARDLRVPRAASLATVCMARRSQLSERLLAILDERRNRRTVSRRFAVPAWIIATLIVIPASAFVPSRALGTFPVIVSAIVPSEGVATEPKARAPRAARGSPLGRAQPERVFTAVDLLGEPTQCDYTKKGNTSINRSSDDEKETSRAHISAGECDLTIRTIGKVRYSSDLSDVVSISAGGSLLVTESDELTTRRVDIRSNADGRLTRKFTVDGVERPWDDEGRRWLATVLVALERRTAFNAETRVPALYKDGGVDAVLKEMALLSGDHARRRYFEALFKTTPSLSESETRRSLEIAGAMESDFEVAQTLIAIAKTGKIGRGSTAYLQAVRNIESDFETRRVLTALLKATTPDAEAMTLLLGVADNIESDFELAQLLLEVSARGLASSDTRDAYFKAVSTIESDFERRRVLTSILKRSDNPDDVRARLLQAASTIESDFELASFLVSFAKAYPEMSPALRETFMKTADSIESEHEYGRVMQSVRGTARRTSGMF